MPLCVSLPLSVGRIPSPKPFLHDAVHIIRGLEHCRDSDGPALFSSFSQGSIARSQPRNTLGNVRTMRDIFLPMMLLAEVLVLVWFVRLSSSSRRVKQPEARHVKRTKRKARLGLMPDIVALNML